MIKKWGNSSPFPQMAVLIHWKPTQTQLVSALAKLHAPPSSSIQVISHGVHQENFSWQGLKTVIYKQCATSPFALIRQDKKLARGCSAREYPEECPACPLLALCVISLLSLWPFDFRPKQCSQSFPVTINPCLLPQWGSFSGSISRHPSHPSLIQPDLLISIIEELPFGFQEVTWCIKSSFSFH